MNMNKNQKRQKEEERRALQAAGRASSLIPIEDIQDCEKPDFKVHAGSSFFGIEVTELLPVSDSFNSPLAERSFHQRMIQLAEKKYNLLPWAIPVSVAVFFWKTESGKYDMEKMARELAEFVQSNREEATPVANFSRHADLTEGFGVISICATYDRPWHGCENVNLTVEQIRQQIAKSISEKNALLPIYRANLPDVPMYLLIYSCAEISRGVPLVHGMDQWLFSFDFDRVFFFSSLDNKAVEFGKNLPRLPR